MSDDYDVPKASAEDVAHTVVRAGLALIPHAGGSIAEVFSALVRPSLDRRREAWMERVVKGLCSLECQLDKLTESERFVTAMMQATQIVLRNHQQEKIEALANAVLNVANDTSPDEDMQTIFLHWIDVFTTSHIKLLKLFDRPKEYIKDNKSIGSLSSVIEQAFPDLRGQDHFYTQVWNDLIAKGLISEAGLRPMLTSHGLLASRTTVWGRSFLRFITSPIESRAVTTD